MPSDPVRDRTEQAVDAVAAAVWDSAEPVRARVRPGWAAANRDKLYAAGVAAVRQDARTAFDAALAFVGGVEALEYRRENVAPAVGWRDVKPWEDIDTFLAHGIRVQERLVSPWFDVDDGTDGKGF